MNAEETNRRLAGLIMLATFVLVVVILRVASDVLIPIAIAVLLTFLLSPLVTRLVRWRLPKIAAVIVTVTSAFIVIAVIGWIVTAQVISLADALPDYETTIRQKVQVLKQPQMPPVLERATGLIKKLRQDMITPPPETERPDEAAEPDETPEAEPPPVKPQPVEVYPPKPTSLQVAQQIVGPALRPLAMAGIVIVVFVAMLFQREDLRDRIIHVCSAGRLNIATELLDDAARRVSRYLRMQLIVNATYGIPVGIGLYIIGVPNALLWGLLAILLRFIPFLGPWIGAFFPVVLALAVDPGWSMFFYTLGLFIVMEAVSNNIIEVRLYGTGTGISAVALLVAAVFWTWLWGAAGLFLSTPLTVCLLVLGRHVPGLRFLSELLGSEPALPPAAQFYQRMLSMDPEGMIDLSSKYLSDGSLVSFYDEVFIPALIMAEQDRHTNSLAEAREEFIFQASRELIEELERPADGDGNGERGEASSGDEIPAPPPPPPPPEPRPRVLIVPASDEADELAGLMLRHALRERGIAAGLSPVTTPPDEYVARIAHERIEVVIVSALPPAAVISARRVCRRLRAGDHDLSRASVIVGVWNRDTTVEQVRARLQRPASEQVVTQLADAVLQIEQLR